jgi:hypothetical protein
MASATGRKPHSLARASRARFLSTVGAVKADDFLRLQELADELIAVAVEEADPAHWPGAGKKPNELTKQERGDRVWAKKNAASCIGLVVDIRRLLGIEEAAASSSRAPGAMSDEEVTALVEETRIEVEQALRKLRK